MKRKGAEPSEEEAAQNKQVKKERAFITQAHIVKVMKAQKTYKYQDVIADVIRNISMFKADPALIKSQIEVLI